MSNQPGATITTSCCIKMHGSSAWKKRCSKACRGHRSGYRNKSQLWACCGDWTPSSHSSGGPGKFNRGAITKTGNAHVRRVIIQAAWTYAKKSSLGKAQARRLKNQPEALVQVGHKARARLCAQYQKLCMKKNSKHAVVAVARELLGFVWAVGIELETTTQNGGLKKRVVFRVHRSAPGVPGRENPRVSYALPNTRT